MVCLEGTHGSYELFLNTVGETVCTLFVYDCSHDREYSSTLRFYVNGESEQETPDDDPGEQLPAVRIQDERTILSMGQQVEVIY